jgi:phosphoglycolate phosphatase
VTRYDAVLFDLDGVLVDSRVAFARSINSALLAHGEPKRPEEELHQYLGPPLHRTFRDLLSEEHLVQPCVDHYRERYGTLGFEESTVFPGIVALLEEWSGRLPLAVATSKPRALAEPLLESLGLRPFFKAVVGPDLATEHEDKAVTLARAIATLPPGAKPIMVGDRKHDVLAAQAHDICAVGVLWGVGSEEELVSAGADVLVRTPAELSALLAPR